MLYIRQLKFVFALVFNFSNALLICQQVIIFQTRTLNFCASAKPGMPEPRVQRVHASAPHAFCIHNVLGAVRVQTIWVQRVHKIFQTNML
jgi:hypothetical protein